MERFIRAVSLVTVARICLEEVDYVYEAMKKYKKLNPFIFKSNTLLADRENVSRFDGYAACGLECFYAVPQEEWEANQRLRVLAGMLPQEYERMYQALKHRLDIYDGVLPADLARKREENLELLKVSVPQVDESLKKEIESLIECFSRLELEAIRCRNKIEKNQEVCTTYEKKLLFRKNALKTAEQAKEFIRDYKAKLLIIEHKKAEIIESIKAAAALKV